MSKEVEIDYTNWRGERSTRRIRPLGITFGSNKWHSRPQWLLRATDLAKGVERTFAMNCIHSWDVTDITSSADEGNAR